MKCPHCNKRFVVPEKAIRHAEYYGGSSSHVKCRTCGKAVKIRTRVAVVADIIGKGDDGKVEAW